MNIRLSRLLIPLILFVLVLTFARLAYSITTSSPLRQFNVTPDTLYLNWTSPIAFRDNITIYTNSTFSGITVKVFNATSALTENYSQSNTVTACQTGSLILKVQNASHLSENATLATEQNVTIIFDTVSCKAGRYRTTNFTIANVTRQNESANITVVLDLPINDTSQTTGIGSFNGVIPAGNATYQSYYFNTSLVPNATSATINLSGWSSPADVDVFLLDDSSTPAFKGRSANKTTTSETLRFQYLPKDAFWEIRVFGNHTSTVSYSGNILYSTLNVTNPADVNFQVAALNYSALNSNQTNNTNITIRNSGNISFSNVAETKELYYTKRLVGNGKTNHSLVIPDSSIFNRVKVILNWTGAGNYSFNLYDLNENLVAYAVNQHVQANVSNVSAEIYNETGSVSGTTGRWIVEVKNNTNVSTNDKYNLTVLMYVNSSAWIATNYSTHSFNRTGNNNSTIDVSINLTVPNTTLDGIYEGQLRYSDGNGAGISLPLWINATAPVLSLNNSMNSMTYRIDENVGANLTRTFVFSINNSGSRDMTLNFIKSPGTLNFTYNSTNGTTVSANGVAAMSVSVSFFSMNSTGTYDGAIFINGTNDTVSSSSRPYQTFNLSLRLNLTTLLMVNVSQLMSITSNNTVTNISIADNVTAKFRVFYINGTDINTGSPNLAGNNFNTSNFSIWLVEGNTSARIPISGNLTISNGTNPLYTTASGYGDDTDYYHVNASVPVNQTGGRYDAYVRVYYNRGAFAFYGEGFNRSLVIQNTGLKATALNSTSISIANASSYNFIVNVTNYGPLTASGATLTLSENCTGWSFTGPTYTNCPSTSFAPTGYNASCLVSWSIVAGSDNASACTGNIVGAPAYVWFNPNEINVSATVTKETSGTSSSSSASATAAAAAAAAANNSLIFSISDSMVYVEQNKTNTSIVQIKNTGSSTQTVTLSIDTLNSSWYSINRTNSTSISSGRFVGYLVTFNPGNADIKDYSGTFKANGSASSATSEFKLRVLPSPEKKTEISTTFNQLNLNFTALSAELNKTKSEGKNITEAQQKFDMLKAKLDQANTYLKNGDYFSAYQLINDIKNLYSETKNALSKSTPAGGLDISKLLGGQAGYLTYILIGGGIAAGVFVAYLFWPTKAQPPPSYGAATKTIIAQPTPGKPLSERFQFLNKIKEFFSKIFKREPKQSYQVK